MKEVSRQQIKSEHVFRGCAIRLNPLFLYVEAGGEEFQYHAGDVIRLEDVTLHVPEADLEYWSATPPPTLTGKFVRGSGSSFGTERRGSLLVIADDGTTYTVSKRQSRRNQPV